MIHAEKRAYLVACESNVIVLLLLLLLFAYTRPYHDQQFVSLSLPIHKQHSNKHRPQKVVAHSTREEKWSWNMVPTTIHRLVSRWTSNWMAGECGFVIVTFVHRMHIFISHKYVHEKWVSCRMLYTSKWILYQSSQLSTSDTFFVYSILFNCFSCHFVFVGFIPLLCVFAPTDASIQL